MRDDDTLTTETFARRFRSCAPTLWCVAAAVVGDREQAQDVLQEAAMIALGKVDGFEPGTNFRAWLAQIVRYVALNHRRRLARRRELAAARPRLELVGDDPVPTGVSARGQLLASQRVFDDAVVAALDDLGDTARACLLLKTVMDLEYTEIAETLAIPVGTAMSHVHRARARMRQTLASTPSSHPQEVAR
ncbi:MAG: RNA polymerase sigma factor [Deltaproteobacteria bacterium]|nr:RNA polymerase sigma factor [Deltaproteobacteria bacterium]